MAFTRILSCAALGLLAPVAGAQTLLFTEAGQAGDRAGSAVAMVGDVDADGAEDFAIGSPSDSTVGSSAGKVIVYSGRTRLPIRTWFGGFANERFGSSIAGVGDVDGDLHDDVVVGASGGNYADVLSGQTSSQLYRLIGPGGYGAAASFGSSVAGGGFVDGDSVPDILVGAPEDLGGLAGGLYVFSGVAGAPIRSHLGTGCADHVGYAAMFLGDVDGDGRDEYATGIPGDSAFCTPKPRVRAYDAASGTPLWTTTAASYFDQLGFSVAALDDVTGDGIAEILAGAPQGLGAVGPGYVILLNGASGGLLWQVDGGVQQAGFGHDVAAIGDVDADGYEDFAVSQPGIGSCGAGSALQIRSGLDGTLLLEIPSPLTANDSFGHALASGDVNDDGLRDLLVGAPCASAPGLESGIVYAYTIVRAPTVYCEAKVNSQGCTPVIFSTGTASLSSGNFRVKAQDVLNKKNGLLFWGRAPTATPFQGAYRCVAAPIERTPLQTSGGNPPPDDCSGLYSYQFTGAYMQSKGIQAGDQIYCQYWSRDPAGFVGTNLTGGLAFYVEP